MRRNPLDVIDLEKVGEPQKMGMVEMSNMTALYSESLFFKY